MLLRVLRVRLGPIFGPDLTLLKTDWWRWRESNPRPDRLVCTAASMFSAGFKLLASWGLPVTHPTLPIP